MVGCSDEPAAKIAVAAPGDRVAWVGTSDALEVVLERVTPLYQEQLSGKNEDALLREAFAIDSEEQLFRLHLFGDSQAVSSSGSVRFGGVELHSFADAPADLNAQERLLWRAVLQGLPLQENEERVRRSLIMRGRNVKDQAFQEGRPQWLSGQRSLTLRREVWSEYARRVFFDAAVAPRSESPDLKFSDPEASLIDE